MICLKQGNMVYFGERELTITDSRQASTILQHLNILLYIQMLEEIYFYNILNRIHQTNNIFFV